MFWLLAPSAAENGNTSLPFRYLWFVILTAIWLWARTVPKSLNHYFHPESLEKVPFVPPSRKTNACREERIRKEKQTRRASMSSCATTLVNPSDVELGGKTLDEMDGMPPNTRRASKGAEFFKALPQRARAMTLPNVKESEEPIPMGTARDVSTPALIPPVPLPPYTQAPKKLQNLLGTPRQRPRALPGEW